MLKILKPIHANRGIEIAYQKALMRLIDDMHNSMQYWIMAQYKATPSRVEKLAQDASTPSDKMRIKLNAVARRWQKAFNEMSKKLAEVYITKQFKATNSAFRKALEDGGWSIKLQL